MNLKRKTLGLAVAAAMGIGALPAHATITGVVGEALLMPLMMNDDTGERHETYVQITVPKYIGRDLVINKYLAPHVNPTGVLVEQGAQVPAPVFAIHWVAYDQNSAVVQSGFCHASPGDSVVWTTDGAYVNEQEDIDSDIVDITGELFVGPVGNPNAAGKVPTSVCGPDTGIPSPKGDLGYVVFETWAGAKGLDADFVMSGTGWIVDDYIEDISSKDEVIIPVPVLPMADGKDTGSPLEKPEVRKNEVITAKTPAGIGVKVNDPFAVAPLAAGIRMNNGDAPPNEDIVVSATVQGDWDGEQGHSMHVFWFDNNDPGREAYTLIWDEHEGSCNFFLPLPDEVNVWMYNATKGGQGLPSDTPGWDKVENYTRSHGDLRLLSINGLLKTPGYPNPIGGDIDEYCEAPFWDQTNFGYAEYAIPEQNDVDGRLSSAGVFFEAQEDNDRLTDDEDGWVSHPMTTLGTQ